MSPGDLEAYWASVRDRVDRRLMELLRSSELEPLYRRAVAGGKRARPLLTHLVGDHLGAPPGILLVLACSVELTHSASLVLDDIIDGHGERRGEPTLHRIEGLRRATMAGFTLPSLAIELAASHGSDAMRLLASAWVAMCRGVLGEEDGADQTLEDLYLGILDAKTSRLFATAAAFGALAAGRGDLVDLALGYGRHVGRAFQMADDVVDIAAGQPLPPALARDPSAVLALARRRLPLEVSRAEALSVQFPGSTAEGFLRSAPAAIVGRKALEVV